MKGRKRFEKEITLTLNPLEAVTLSQILYAFAEAAEQNAVSKNTYPSQQDDLRIGVCALVNVQVQAQSEKLDVEDIKRLNEAHRKQYESEMKKKAIQN